MTRNRIFAGPARYPRISAAAALLAGLLASCALPQWKKGHLADPIMQFDEDPEGKELDQRLLPTREGSSGGTGAAGGGCGC